MKKLSIFITIIFLSVTLSSCLRSADGSITPLPHDEVPTNVVTAPDDTVEPTETTVPIEPDITDTSDENDLPAGDPTDEKQPETTEPKDETPPGEDPVPTVGEPDSTGVVAVAKIELDRYETTLTVGQIDMPWETLYPTNATNKYTTWSSSDTRVATVDEYGRVTAVGEGQCVVTDRSVQNPDVAAEFLVTVKHTEKLTSPTYIDGIMIANKSYPLPEDYNPGIDADAKAALDEMISGAAKDGITLTMISGFRSYETQQNLYARYLLREGRDAADTYSARPGYSEHQTGLAFDLNSLEYSFGETREGKWLAEHCAEYGFIIRYPDNKEEITGYHYEPWHVRYLGVETAKKVHESGLCLEEYLGITSKYE